MSNKYGIPEKDLRKIRTRDTLCVYCHKKMIYPWNSKNIADSAEIEHLNHIKEWDSIRSFVREGKPVSTIVAICCGSCNRNRRDKALRKWFKDSYCTDRQTKIDETTVADVVKEYIRKHERGII